MNIGKRVLVELEKRHVFLRVKAKTLIIICNSIIKIIINKMCCNLQVFTTAILGTI